jgi:hypothetical protein
MQESLRIGGNDRPSRVPAFTIVLSILVTICYVSWSRWRLGLGLAFDLCGRCKHGWSLNGQRRRWEDSVHVEPAQLMLL